MPRAALEGQDLPCTNLAHQELGSVIIIIIIIINTSIIMAINIIIYD